MNDLLAVSLTALGAYLIGGIPFGWLVARSKGIDIYKEGSGNIGATNVGRVLGKKFGILVFVLDFAKGAIPVAVAMQFANYLDISLNAKELGVIAGLSAVLGHMFPIYLKLRGGKGVATGAGVVAVLLPIGMLIGFVVWIGVVAATRLVSLASLAAALALLLTRMMIATSPFARDNVVLSVFCLIVAALVFIRHHTNIARLIKKTEPPLEESSKMTSLTKTIHVLAMGLWFGTAVFFSFVVGLSMFSAMGELAKQSSQQSSWFEVPQQYEKPDDKIDGGYEYTTRIAGHAISPMFDWYFLLQGFCGFLAVATAWSWQFAEPNRKIHRRRVTVLLLAIITVVIGWPLERHVSELRHSRHKAMDAYFATDAGSPGTKKMKDAALEAKAEFGTYHTYSLFLNFATIAFVSIGMGMAAFLPESKSKANEKKQPKSAEQPQQVSD